MSDIPCIDIAPFLRGTESDKAATARAFGRAFEEIGFAAIVGHGVPEGLIHRTYDVALAFFGLPLAEKMTAMPPERVKSRGYLPVGIESVARTRGDDRPADLCEALVFQGLNRDAEDLPPGTVSPVTGNVVPRRPVGLYPLYHAYFLAMRDLVGTLMRLSALALDLPETFFEPFMDNRRGTLRTVFYPDQPEEPKPGQLRYGAHSDYGGLTILRQDDAPGGLQACLKSGAWIDVPPIPGSFVLNIGDLMARWTNDRWRSTLHRVMNPPRDLTGSTQRLSLVFFSGPNDDALIECLPSCADAAHPAKYPPVRAAEYVASKLAASMPEKLAVS
ncbi:MAG TPA: 2OG-Fe(II) oxygenase family protein [Alphaproteobacteria bacterium]|nr:2OG-Fe(II) oxygenase family protein [Alphaproteobacteria bacterium]